MEEDSSILHCYCADKGIASLNPEDDCFQYVQVRSEVSVVETGAGSGDRTAVSTGGSALPPDETLCTNAYCGSEEVAVGSDFGGVSAMSSRSRSTASGQGRVGLAGLAIPSPRRCQFDRSPISSPVLHELRRLMR